MLNKRGCPIFTIGLIVVALAVAVTAGLEHSGTIHSTYTIHIIRFLDAMIPALAVGSLLKYLFSSTPTDRCNHQRDAGDDSGCCH